jgi:hypothetical protein
MQCLGDTTLVIRRVSEPSGGHWLLYDTTNHCIGNDSSQSLGHDAVPLHEYCAH